MTVLHAWVSGRSAELSEELVDELAEIEAMFVQTAHATTYEDGRLTLRGVAASTLYFSDRPRRVVGHIGTAQFVALWDEGENSFAEDPPNAVLAFLEPGDEMPDEAMVVLREPQLQNGDFSYSIDVLEGWMPPSTGAVTLFVDPFGRPLSPLSVAAVRRRAHHL